MKNKSYLYALYNAVRNESLRDSFLFGNIENQLDENGSAVSDLFQKYVGWRGIFAWGFAAIHPLRLPYISNTTSEEKLLVFYADVMQNDWQKKLCHL